MTLRQVDPAQNGRCQAVSGTSDDTPGAAITPWKHLGAQWALLRMCRTCGHIGCCDTSRYKHATAHFHATGHPIVKLLERVEETDWCYVDALYVGGQP